MYRLFAYDPPTGKEYYNRFWVGLFKYMAGKRNQKAARGRILVSKEVLSGSALRVQARILDPASKPYPPEGAGSLTESFRIVQITPGGQEKTVGTYPLTAKVSGEFEGYYQGQIVADPSKMPPGDFRYRIVVNVPDSVADILEGEFIVRKADPELDNTRPDFAALLEMASPWDQDLDARRARESEGENCSPKLPQG